MYRRELHPVLRSGIHFCICNTIYVTRRHCSVTNLYRSMNNGAFSPWGHSAYKRLPPVGRIQCRMAINRTFASFVEEAMLLQEQGEQEEYVYGYPGGYHESEDVVSYAEGPSVEERCALRLGYTCDNLLLKRTRKIHTSRGCIRKTFEEKGLAHVSQLALANCLDLLELIAWNHANGIHLYRMTSKLFPWAGHYELEELPEYELICAALSAAGDVARAADQRITNHPSHFIKLASSNESIIESSIKDLEVQSRVFDLMGYTPSHWNKVCVFVCGEERRPRIVFFWCIESTTTVFISRAD